MNYATLIYNYKNHFNIDLSLIMIENQLMNGENIIDRNNMNWHFTCSPFVFTPDFTKLLCIYHRHRQVRQQPGWHIDDMSDHPFIHWLRELYEETGISIVRLHDRHINNNLCPLNIDIQDVQPRPEKNEWAHQHYDIQFICLATEQSLQSDDEGIQSIERKKISDLSNEMQQRVQLLKERLWLKLTS